MQSCTVDHVKMLHILTAMKAFLAKIHWSCNSRCKEHAITKTITSTNIKAKLAPRCEHLLVDGSRHAVHNGEQTCPKVVMTEPPRQ